MPTRLRIPNEAWYLRRRWLGLVVALAYAAAFWQLASHFTSVQLFIAHLGPWAPAAFTALYLILAPLFFPLSLLDLTCGALFGVQRGFWILVTANGLAAMEMFVLARWLLARRVSDWIERRPRWSRFRKLVERDQWKILSLVRLSPMNFAIASYLMGAARVRLDHYLLTILVPKSLLHVSIGATLLRLGRQGSTAPSARTGRWEFILAAAGLVSLLLLVVFIGLRARQAIEDAASHHRGSPDG